MCKAKASGNYTLSILAHQEVAHSGYDEAMLMDPQGYVCQGSGENVFLIKDGVLHTQISLVVRLMVLHVKL